MSFVNDGYTDPDPDEGVVGAVPVLYIFWGGGVVVVCAGGLSCVRGGDALCAMSAGLLLWAADPPEFARI